MDDDMDTTDRHDTLVALFPKRSHDLEFPNCTEEHEFIDDHEKGCRCEDCYGDFSNATSGDGED